jgi:hypothetical protein
LFQPNAGQHWSSARVSAQVSLPADYKKHADSPEGAIRPEYQQAEDATAGFRLNWRRSGDEIMCKRAALHK